jgi:ABC-type transport system substrate-binding protein
VHGIEVLGDTAVAFTLTEPLAIFPKFLAMPVAAVVPSSVTPTSANIPSAPDRGASSPGSTTTICASPKTRATGAARR